MTNERNQDDVAKARTALEGATAARDRFRASIDALAERIAAAQDVSAAMPLHAELETRRIFLARVEADVSRAEAALTDAERNAERARLVDLAKSADPETWRAKLASLTTQALESEQRWLDDLAAVYAALAEQRAMAKQAGSEALPAGAADALLTMARFEARRPSLRIMVPQTRTELLPAVLAYCDALRVASDFEFRSTLDDDAMLSGALDGSLLPRYEAWDAERKRKHAAARAGLEERERKAREDHEAWYRDPANETLRARAEASRTAALNPPVQTQD